MGPATTMSQRFAPQVRASAVEVLEMARARGVVLCTNGLGIGYWPATGKFLTPELEVAIDLNRQEILGLLAAEWSIAARTGHVSDGVH